MLRHLAGLAEIVDDFSAALAFYRDTLGLEIKQQMGDDYALVSVPGVFHFGIWNRAHAAEAVFGSRDAADRIPLGFTIEFEVDDVDRAAQQLAARGVQLTQQPKTEPWGQRSCRLIALGGGLLGFAETPWARQIRQHLEAGEQQ
jgi:catechol 2,3-dioxygenase-like lactoylglutathione lyase family enzyme